ncbi:DUF1270 family protein, partial [Staphylococcus aureus]
MSNIYKSYLVAILCF